MHLLQRGTTSTFQIRVPSDLVRILGDTPFRTSLGALTRREAQRRARLLAGHAELAFVRVRRVVLETAAEGSEIDEGLRAAIDEALSGLACAYDERYQPAGIGAGPAGALVCTRGRDFPLSMLVSRLKCGWYICLRPDVPQGISHHADPARCRAPAAGPA